VKVAVTIDPVKLLRSIPAAATTDPTVKVGLRTWIVKLKTDRVAIFPTNASRVSSAVAVEEDLVAVIASAEADSAAVIALVEVASAEAGLADSAVAVGDGGNN
jgi:hypothetical protein